jgi:hypothetical protein
LHESTYASAYRTIYQLSDIFHRTRECETSVLEANPIGVEYDGRAAEILGEHVWTVKIKWDGLH